MPLLGRGEGGGPRVGRGKRRGAGAGPVARKEMGWSRASGIEAMGAADHSGALEPERLDPAVLPGAGVD